MTDELSQSVSRAAERLVGRCRQQTSGAALDYSPGSLEVVEGMVGEAAPWAAELTQAQADGLVRDVGCYMLEVARREFSGRLLWHEESGQPVLLVGEPAARIMLVTWGRVRQRLAGEATESLPAFYAGFAEQAREARLGVDALHA